MTGWFGARLLVRIVDDNPTQSPADPAFQRLEWSREVYAVADRLRQTGRQRQLRDITIVLPVDHHAIEAIELACQALMEGELSTASCDLDSLFDHLASDEAEAALFLNSVRNVVRRIGR